MNRRLRQVKGLAIAAVAAGAAAAYMLFESQWLRCHRETLEVESLPEWLQGFTILHLSDVHAGEPGFNLYTLQKAVDWTQGLDIDLCLLTGDIVGGRRGSRRCLELLSRIPTRFGLLAVPGNHEYGLSKNPFVHRAEAQEWTGAGIHLLRDSCADLVVGPSGEILRVCGADYITGGHPLKDMRGTEAAYALLMTHRPPLPGDDLAGSFPLAFAGHTHGGQIRLPSPWGLMALHREALPYVEGVHEWGGGTLVISRGLGTSFLPLRLFTRPRVDLYMLSRGIHDSRDERK